MDEKEILAQNLTRYRKNAGISQLELAKKLCYSNKNISKWENGETMPNAFILQKIANIYGVTIEDLLSQNNTIKPLQEVPKKNYRKTIFRLTMLFLANAIMYTFGTFLIYVLKMVNVSNFNLWLIYLYLSPLSFLSITIYLRVLYKYVDIISLSLFIWMLCLMFYLTFKDIPNFAYIFALGGAFQIIIICIVILVNLNILKLKIKSKYSKKDKT